VDKLQPVEAAYIIHIIALDILAAAAGALLFDFLRAKKELRRALVAHRTHAGSRPKLRNDICR
jgi:hypothetical protein